MTARNVMYERLAAAHQNSDTCAMLGMSFKKLLHKLFLLWGHIREKVFSLQCIPCFCPNLNPNAVTFLELGVSHSVDAQPVQ